MKLFFYHTPEAVPPDGSPNLAIAIDVLRATTTIATLLAAGAEAVQVFSDLEALTHTRESWAPKPGLRIGERGGQKVAGFDLGNSPLDCTAERVANCRIFMSTTNGTRALQRIQDTPIVLAAALINRLAVVQYLHQHQPETVWMVGSGWEGSFSLEDTVCAGAILDSLLAMEQQPLKNLAGNDEAVAALALFQSYQHNLLSLLEQASHGQRLLHLQLDNDLKYCAQTDVLDILPIQREAGILVSWSLRSSNPKQTGSGQI
ncbi:2-phosphosulfolactate phosphatase family protein [Synechococcales cyanobacterium C]|uniref:Probable 2-phosphosulfolactate phosphatase n=1 Tax=Petrachloros mirabilis ULC683 TaxID=2781853 RepID=A0A8K1ZXJ5_9CYAN|nr:2-phosphosulfolactate phosphatase family protein [Petrachloros mirabilis]NCJ05723.1 2-phosphosulfolactate phosphatase family protein [Petrachloros mirabilis ULC683]